jgi:hypothetical protein
VLYPAGAIKHFLMKMPANIGAILYSNPASTSDATK